MLNCGIIVVLIGKYIKREVNTWLRRVVLTRS
jgi:hypothetical protein